MKAKIFVPFSNGDCVNGFKYENGDISQKEYANMMIKEYMKYRDSIDETVRKSYSKNMSINPFAKENNEYKHQTYSYNDCNCNIYNIQGKDANIDELISYYRTKEEFVIIVEMFSLNDYENVDLEIDMKMWIKDSAKILGTNKLSDEEKIYYLPKKDFKIKFFAEKSNAILKDCKLFEMQDKNVFAISIKRIIFTKE